MAQNIEPDWNNRASEFLGYISVGCWLVVLVPQYIENYRRKSGDGVSLACVLSWVLGDVANFIGCAIQGLLPSIILVACYFLTIDTLMVSQITYYQIVYKKDASGVAQVPEQSTKTDVEDEIAAASSSNSSNSSGESSSSAGYRNHPANKKRADTCQSETAPVPCHTEHATLLPTRIPSDDDGGSATTTTTTSGLHSDFKYRVWQIATFIAILVLAGVFYLAWMTSRTNKQPNKDVARIAQLLGYVSAIVYIGSYVIQAIHNYQTKSTEGLSVLLFVFTVGGNLTYCLSILIVSVDPSYLRLYLPWLLGASVPTIVHCVIFYQFYLYSKKAHVLESGCSTVV